MERRNGVPGRTRNGGIVSKKSPHKKSAKPKAKMLSIEFAGICSLIRKKNSAAAEIWLPDVMKAAPPAQRTRHFASMIVKSEEEQKHVADSAVTFPGHDPEYTVWNLADTTVRFESDGPKGLTTPSNPAGKRAGSVTKLADIWSISGPTGFQAQPPNTCTVTVADGELASVMPPTTAQKYVFYKGNSPTPGELKAAQVYAWRIRVRIPFKKEVRVVLANPAGERVLTFAESTDAVIANLCQEVGSKRNHFYAYYGLVEGATPRNIKKVKNAAAKKPGGGVGEYYPNWEYCFTSRISEV